MSHHHDASGWFAEGQSNQTRLGVGVGVGEGRDADKRSGHNVFGYSLGMTNTFQVLECNPSDFSRVLKEGR